MIRMIRSLHSALVKVPQMTSVALVVLLIVCGQGFEARRALLSGGEGFLDSRWSYSPADAVRLLASLGVAGRRWYAFTELTLDVLFPAAYGLLFALLLSHLFHGARWHAVVLLPLAAGAFDWLENGTLAYLALSFDCRESVLAVAAQSFTRVKTILLTATLGALLLGVASSLRRRT